MGCFSSKSDVPDNYKSQNKGLTVHNIGRKRPNKIVFLGDTGVGKSSVILRYIKGMFQATSEPTIGAAYVKHTVNIDLTPVHLEIWDTAGQERYRALANMYYREAKIGVIMYDISDKNSWLGAISWHRELQSEGSEDMHIFLVGNKIDLEHNREVIFDDAAEYAKDNKMIHLEVSAKSSEGVSGLFLKMAKKLLENIT